ncbi:cell growth regulator with RING finger domain protein 1 isoform X2 [Brachyhypopomus gauderio]|uniref:cell growth regulator with RING finger domain protein 1 isoform X2 n=1 Tax=Brachyhypopomus gauderio TaxID=698409 RepID=UPI004040F4FF
MRPVRVLTSILLIMSRSGFDVPVILRSSDEAESFLPVPEKKMVQVTNPFALELGVTPCSVTQGVTLRPRCLENSVLSCFWGCGVQTLQAALQRHYLGPRLTTPHLFQEALQFQYLHCQTFNIQKDEKEEYRTHMPAALGLTHFGLLPREHYPLVAVLTLANSDDRDIYNIVASVTVVHVPDEKYSLSARILFQYLLTVHGNMYDLKPLFMSTDDNRPPEHRDSTPTMEGVESHTKPPDKEGEESEEEEGWPGAPGKDCVVCQNAPVNRVLLPCRHTCVCNGCITHFQHCPMCRAFVVESFTLSSQAPSEHIMEE